MLLALLLACADPAASPSDPEETDVTADVLPDCPAFADGVQAGTVASAEAQELSGLVASRAWPGVWWAHNDSGDGARLLAIGEDGADLGVFPLAGANAADWEDIAIGPDGDGWSIWIGDIGDNFLLRQELWIWRVSEPDVTAPGEVAATRIRLRYPDGPHDAEALLVDPRTGDLLIVSKDAGGSMIYLAAAPVTDGQELELIGSVAPWAGTASDGLVTGGDLAPDGSAALLRTYGAAWIWRRTPRATLSEAFATDPCPVPLAAEPGGEAIAWEAEGGAYRSVSEGPAPVLWRYVAQ
jgi:hypothetical protein